MSSNYWQTEKRKLQLKSGSTTTEKVMDYIQIWRKRCYSNDIPECVPELLGKTLRVPSYKAIAISILKNDLNLYTAGNKKPETENSQAVYFFNKNCKNKQGQLF